MRRPRQHSVFSKVDTQPEPFSTESDLQNSIVAILEGHEEFVLSTDGKIISSNLEAVNVTGYEEWDVIGKSFSIFYLLEEISTNLLDSHLSKTREAGKTTFEGWKLKKRGIKFFARLRYTVMRNSLNEITGYRVVINDITQKVAYNSRLMKMKEKYLSIYNNAFVGIITISTDDFHIIHSNAKAKQILGEKSGNLQEAFESSSEFEIFKQKLAKEQTVNGFEFKTKFTDRREKWILFDGHVHGNLIEGVIIDVTLIKQQEMAITKLSKEVDSFIYHASHELRAPMTTILGITNLLSTERNGDPVVSNYVNMIRERVKLQDELLRDLTSVIYNNTAAVSIEEFLFRDELESVITDFNELYPHVKTNFELLTTVPLRTDIIRMRTVIRSILSNSFKYHSAVSPWIHICVFEDGGNVCISISDNGVGMTDDQLKLVFNLFHRSHEGYPGNGLGLYVAKSIMTVLNGDIKIKSRKNVGTQVTLILS